MKNDKRAIFHAAAMAEHAAGWLHDQQPGAGDDETHPLADDAPSAPTASHLFAAAYSDTPTRDLRYTGPSDRRREGETVADVHRLSGKPRPPLPPPPPPPPHPSISRPYDPDRYRQPGEPRSSRKCDHGLEFLGSQAKLYHVELVAHRTAQLDRVQQSTPKIATTHDTPMGPTPARPESIAPGDRASPEALASPAT